MKEAVGRLEIKFKLRDIERIEPWGKPGEQHLSWFGLTDGAYCIETAAGRLLEFTGDSESDLGVAWCDYHVVRLFDDLMDVWPYVREPVPPDILTRYFAWRPREKAWFDTAGRPAIDPWYEATSWWSRRAISFSYLRTPPRLHLWRSQSSGCLEWRSEAPWSPPAADLSFPFELMQQAVASFSRDFLAAMAARVAEIERSRWQPKDAVLNIPHLVMEHRQREEEAEQALHRVAETDWTAIRLALDKLGAAAL